MPGMPAPGTPAPGAPAAPKVVPTSIKPTAPPPGILDLDNADSFKVDASKPPVPPALKPPLPGMPPVGGKPIVKDMGKEGEGELIE